MAKNGKMAQIFFFMCIVHHPHQKTKKKSIAKLNSIGWFLRNLCWQIWKKSRKTQKCHIFTSYKRNYIQKVLKWKVLTSLFKWILGTTKIFVTVFEKRKISKSEKWPKMSKRTKFFSRRIILIKKQKKRALLN